MSGRKVFPSSPRAHRVVRRTWVAAVLGLFTLSIGGFPFAGLRAAALTSAVTLGDPAAGATTSVEISFTVGTAVPNGGYLVVSKPAGYANFTPGNVTSKVTVTVNGNPDSINSATMAAGFIEAKIGNSGFSSGAVVVITIAASAGIVNPATQQGYSWVVTSQNASQNTNIDTYTGSASVTGTTTSTSSTTTTAASTTTTVASSTTTAATTTTAGATTTTAAATTTTRPATTTSGASTTTVPGAQALDPRPSASKDISDLVNIDLTPTDDADKLGGSFELRPGPDDPALQLISIFTRTITNGVEGDWVKKSATATPETNVTVNYAGADYNKPETWKAEGFGEDCWKIDWTTTEYVHALPTPSVTAKRDLTGWTYTNVIVKAGSITDPTLQVNTIFKAPAVGSGVYPDVNRNGISDPTGRTGDKAISHVVYCGKSGGSSTSSTVGGNQASTSTTAAATTTTRASTSTTAAATTTTARTGATTTTTSGTRRTTTTTTVPGSKDPINVAMTSDPKVTLCHRTSSRTNPYVSITVDASSVLKEGHGSHTGPLFPDDNWGDIIPAFGDYPGLNWPAGQGILEAGCDTDKIVENFTKDGKVTLCHRTSSRTNPYVSITVDANSVVRQGHGSHTGPLFPDDNWGDIIPPFTGYAGLNWPGGQAILASGCQMPSAITTTTTPSQSTVNPNAVTSTTSRGRTTTTVAGATTTTSRSRTTTTIDGATTTTARPGATTTTVRPGVTTTTRPGATTTTPSQSTVNPNAATTTAPRASTTTIRVTTTTVANVDGQWNPETTPTTVPSASTQRRREACASSSSFDAQITQVQMLLSRGTSQEVVEFEVCMNTFKVTAANAPLEAFGEAVTVDPEAVPLAAEVPNVGSDSIDLVWIAAILMALGVVLLGGARRFDD